MKADVAYWRRLEPDDANRTYDWLRRAVETNIRLDKEDKNQDKLQAHNRKPAGRQPAAPGKGDKGAGKSGKDKNKKGEGKGTGDKTPGKGKGKGGKKGGSGTSTPGGRKPPGEIPCRFLYGFGRCSKGAECDYAHRTPSKQEILDYNMYKQDENSKGTGKGKSKGRCQPFFDTGKCKYGDSCIFSHSDKDKAKPKAKPKAKGAAKKRARSAAPAEQAWEEEEEEEEDE